MHSCLSSNLSFEVKGLWRVYTTVLSDRQFRKDNVLYNHVSGVCSSLYTVQRASVHRDWVPLTTRCNLMLIIINNIFNVECILNDIDHYDTSTSIIIQCYDNGNNNVAS